MSHLCNGSATRAPEQQPQRGGRETLRIPQRPLPPARRSARGV